jgi:hypothetical protein
MKVKQLIINQNPEIKLNIAYSKEKLNYSLEINHQIIEPDSDDFGDTEELIDDLKETLAYELSERFPEYEELYSDEFIERLDSIVEQIF